jgi:hypothetical protein
MKIWYIVASCWIFLYELHYDVRIHEHQRSQMVRTFSDLGSHISVFKIVHMKLYYNHQALFLYSFDETISMCKVVSSTRVSYL